MICSKCNLDKPEMDYATYFHSTQGKLRRRRVCNACFNAQKKLYRESIKNKIIVPQIEDMEEIEPIVEEVVTPIVENESNIVKEARKFVEVFEGIHPNEDEPGYKKCKICKEWKHKETNFYKSGGKNFTTYCINCAKAYEKVRKKAANDRKKAEGVDEGSTEGVDRKPGVYRSEYQKECTFNIMHALGWTYNEENGKWWKLPIKDENGIFIILKDRKFYRNTKKVETVSKQKVRYRKKQYIWDRQGDIKDLRNVGKMTFENIAKLFNVSTPLIREIYYAEDE